MAKNTHEAFEPINDAHAIIEIAIYIQVAPAFSKRDIDRLLSLEHELKNDLPKTQQVLRMEGTFGRLEDSLINNVDERIVGIEMQNILPDGKMGWQLKTTDEVISVNCLDYSRWQEVLEKTSRYLRKSFERLENSEAIIHSLGLKYVDGFLFAGDIDRYTADGLFRQDSGHLTQRSFASDTRWHCHTGWYDPVPDEGFECLNQLNIDAGFRNLSGERKHLTTVDHNVVMRIPPSEIEKQAIGTFVSLGKPEKNGELRLNNLLQILHKKNKEVLSKLLVPTMSQAINLRGASV